MAIAICGRNYSYANRLDICLTADSGEATDTSRYLFLATSTAGDAIRKYRKKPNA